ncbi:hypothetical protein YTPLAS21_21430 [Candidatus Nitrosocosmicus sp.]|nr:hypothetical protein YTPLAS21_21430 [Candidatus Nitrosocosmicus sp.]
MDIFQTEIFWGAFLGSLFAFLFNIFLSYVKNRNKLKFNLLKTYHLLDAYHNLTGQYKEEYENLLNLDLGSLSEVDLKLNETKIKEAWFELKRKDNPFELIKLPLNEIYPLVKYYKDTLNQILTADLAMQSFMKLKDIRNNHYDIFLEKTENLKDEELDPGLIKKQLGVKKYTELEDVTYNLIRHCCIASEELEKSKKQLIETRKKYDNWLKHLLHIACSLGKKTDQKRED